MLDSQNNATLVSEMLCWISSKTYKTQASSVYQQLNKVESGQLFSNKISDTVKLGQW